MLNIEPLLLQIKNRRPVVIIAPLVFGLFAGGMLVVKPGLGLLNNVKADISSLQEKVSAYLFVLDGETNLLVYKKKFSGDKTWLIEQINTIAENSDVSILSILPEEPGKIGDNLDRNSVRIDAESNYHQLGAFVSQLESLDAYVKIISVQISAGSSGAQQKPASGPWQDPNARTARTQNTNVYQVSVSVGLLTPIAGAQ